MTSTPRPGSPRLSLLSLPRTPLDSNANSRPNSPALGKDRGEKASALAADPRWKKYTALVDKSLASFDAIKEWADFIAFLARLLRTLQAYGQAFDDVPRKLAVAKRLAQCLTPSLPSGVHQRTLDVYGHILKVIGPDGLRRDLLIWSSGLFPFFQYASTAAKPQLLDLYEKHYLPLEDGLRPATKALTLALLPGLEEATGEFFDKVMYFLDYLSSVVSPPFFLQNIWLILISAPAARPTALAYLAKRLPKLGPEDDITLIVGADVGLMIRAFAACLDDSVVLVQRGILDLLVTSLRLDGAASAGHTAPDDRLLLMRAASAVVLRRDLSLSRRLYTWLSGTGETPESQVAFLREHGLELLRESLAAGMAGDEAETLKSYRIFNSLLDKWEIGYPLSEALVLDTLRSFQRHDLGHEKAVSVAASTLFESLDPFVVWQQLFLAVKGDFETPGQHEAKNVALLDSTLRSFPPGDDEVLHFYLPVLFASCISLLRTHLGSPDFKIGPQVLALLSDILHLLPASVFASDQPAAPPADDAASEDPLPHALKLYAGRADDQPPGGSQYPGFAGPMLVRLSLEGLLHAGATTARVHEERGAELVAVLSLVEQLLSEISGGQQQPVVLLWKPETWLASMADVAEKTSSFAVLQQVIATTLELGSVDALRPSLKADSPPTLAAFMTATLAFLSGPETVNHTGAVRMVWDMHRLSSRTALDITLFRDLASPSTQSKLHALAALGVLWRHDDSADFGEALEETSIFAVLDALSSKNVTLRRAGEGWLRLNLKSPVQVVDPLLSILLDPHVVRSSTTASHNGRQFSVVEYAAAFDAPRASYVLESLLALHAVGGAAFNGSLRSASFRGASERLRGRAEAAGLRQVDRSFQDVVCEVLLLHVQTGPSSSSPAAFSNDVGVVQLDAALLLQAIVAAGNLTPTSLHIAELALVNTLFSEVRHARLDLQPQLLLTLHDVLRLSSASTSGAFSDPRTSTSSRDGPPEAAVMTTEQAASFFLQTLMDGLSAASNLPVLPQWVDFILRTVPLFHGPLRALLNPLSDCVVGRVSRLGDSLLFAVEEAGSTSTSPPSVPLDLDVVAYLDALEQVTSLAVCASSGKQGASGQAVRGTADSSSGLRGYVSGVFGGEGASEEGTADSSSTHLSPGTRSLLKAVRALHDLWTATAVDWVAHAHLVPEGLQALCATTRSRTQEVLEQLYRLESLDVVQMLADVWGGGSVDNPTSFEILDALVTSSQGAVAVLVQILSSRAPTGNEKGAQRGSPSLDGRDLVLFDFLEAYISRLDAPLAVQNWSTLFGFAKDVSFANVDPTARSFAYPVLRSVTALADKVATTSALQDRRLRTELQATFSRLVETVATIAGRRCDVGNGGAAAAKARAPKTATRESFSQVTYPNIARFVADEVMPNLRRFLVTDERVLAAANIVNTHMVVPALKSKTTPICADPLPLALLRLVALVPGTLKSWRPLVADPFADARFFAVLSPAGARAWEPLVLALVDGEKDRLVELISRISAPPSAGLFTSRDAEMHLRVLHVRRLTFLLLAGPANHFVLHVPTLQQNLVEVLRTPGLAAQVYAEVYLCLRVLVRRMGASVLGNLWPVILTELVRILEQAVDTTPPDGSDALVLVVAGLRFLDLLLVLRLEDFQIHQWMFVPDTVPDDVPVDDSTAAALLAHSAAAGADLSSGPLLSRLAAAVRALPPSPLLAGFLETASGLAFERAYGAIAGGGAGGVDWEAVEGAFRVEVFDG